MIHFTTGNLFDTSADALVNTVNCVGVMGRGIALQFKKSYPDNFKEYAKACKAGEVIPGKMFVHSTDRLTSPSFIINFPTKRHWKEASRLEDIETGLKDLVSVIQKNGITSIAIPPLGCGLGGLDWTIVKARIEEALKDLTNVDIIVYAPNGAPEANQMTRNTKIPKITPGRAALITLMSHYLQALLDPEITLLELHKLMYFLQESGQPLKLNYGKAEFGPYAKNLRHVLNELEGHMISGYADGGDNPRKPLSSIPGAIEDAQRHLELDQDMKKHIAQVVDLVQGFESSFGLELLATVHWVAKYEKIQSKEDLHRDVYNWSDHKKIFSSHHIDIAYDTLKQKGWATVCF
ncbi:MAG: macro domain-containing protein [Akkermansia sp.]